MWWSLSSFALGCVNDYVVRDDDGATSIASDDETTTMATGPGDDESGTSLGMTQGTGSADDTSAGTVPDPGPSSDDSSDASAGDPSTGGAGDTGTQQFNCEPCTADDQCGDDFDNCVDLDGDGLRCVFSCPEAGCPPDLDCAATTSVDGVMAVQCVPVAPMC